MSTIDDLRSYLASADCSIERMEEILQMAVQATIVSGVHPDHIISAIYAMLEFEARMTRIKTMAGTASEDIQAISQAIEAMADIPEAKPPAKLPYYQKNKQQWWR